MERQLLPHTRVHPFPLVQRPGLQLYLKRDDEAGGLTAAGKLRKYASLLPALSAQGVQQAAIIGSTNSNNLVGLAQLLIQRGIRPVPFVLEGHHSGSNAFYLRLLVPERDWVVCARADWAEVHTRAHAWQRAQEAQSQRSAVIPEGCWMPEALPGAMTLAADIRAHELELGLRFSHVIMDAGTGLSAMGLCAALRAEQTRPVVHAVSMADGVEAFEARWVQVCEWLGQDAAGVIGEGLQLHIPRNARAYGSLNATVLQDVVRFARESGVLCDPVYNAKLFAEAEALLRRDTTLEGNILLIHSGGAHTLPAYSDRLAPLLS